MQNFNGNDPFSAHYGDVMIPRVPIHPTGLRLGFREPVGGMVWLQNKCAVEFVGRTVHAHPQGAATRAAFYETAVSDYSNPDTSLYVCVGESNTRPNCFNLVAAERVPQLHRRQAPFHFMRPMLDAWDVLRSEDAMGNIVAGQAYGTTCACTFSFCDHIKHAVTEMSMTRRVVNVVVLLYDVYDITLAMIEQFFNDTNQYHIDNVVLKCDIQMGLTKFNPYQGVAFGGEYAYRWVPGGKVLAMVKGNGNVPYGPHDACFWAHTCRPQWGNLVWKMTTELGPADEVAVYRFVYARNYVLREPPLLLGYEYAHVHEDEVQPTTLIPIELATELRLIAQGQVRDNRLQSELYRRARRIVSGRDPHVKLTVPEVLREEIVLVAVKDALTYVSPHENDMMTGLDQRAVELAQHNFRLRNWGMKSAKWVVALSVVAVVLFKLLMTHGFVNLFSGWLYVLMSVLGAAAGGIALTIVVVSFAIMFGVTDVRQIAFSYRLPTHRLFWTYVILLMLMTTAVAQDQHVKDSGVTDYCEDIGPMHWLRHMECPTQYPAYHSTQGLKEVDRGAKYKVIDVMEHRVSAGPTVFGGASVEAPVSVPAACQCNEIVALANRALLAVPGCAAGAWDEAFDLFESFYTKAAARVQQTFPIDILTWEEWLHRDGYTDAFRAKMLVAKDSLVDFKLPSLKKLRDNLDEVKLTAKDYYRNFFVKIEKWIKDVEYAPRAIQGMSDRLQATIGPFFYSLSKVHNKVLGVESPICYGPGLTAEQIGAWIEEWSETYPFYYAADAVRFDAHLKRPAFERINKFYKSVVMAPRRVTDAVEGKIDKIGYTRFGIRYEVEGTRASGDSDTTEGNTGFTIASTNAALIKQGFQGPGIDYALIAAGDDQLFFTSRPIDEVLYHKYQLGLGLEIELIPGKHLYQIDFLSALAYPSADGVVMGPKIGRLLARLGTASTPQSDYAEYMYSVAHGLFNLTHHVPILRTLIWKMMSLGTENDKIEFEHFKMNATAAHGIHSDVYGFVCDRYNVSLSTIDEIEAEITGVWVFPHVWEHPAIIDMIKTDG